VLRAELRGRERVVDVPAQRHLLGSGTSEMSE
jgi:hypothetical protein